MFSKVRFIGKSLEYRRFYRLTHTPHQAILTHTLRVHPNLARLRVASRPTENRVLDLFPLLQVQSEEARIRLLPGPGRKHRLKVFEERIQPEQTNRAAGRDMVDDEIRQRPDFAGMRLTFPNNPQS